MPRLIVLTVFVVAIFLSSTSFARSISEDNQVLNLTMTEIGQTLVDAYPFILAKRELTAKEVEDVGEILKRLKRLFLRAGPYIKQKSRAYQVSYQYVLKHLEQTQSAYDKKDVRFVRQRLTTLGTVCISCHTQDTELRTLFPGASRQQFPDDYSYAEFNFTTRNYEEAERYFDQYLATGQAETELAVIRPLQRLVTIYTQIFNQPGLGAKKLSKYIALKSHSPQTKKYLAEMVVGMKTLEGEGVSKIEKINFAQIEDYVQKYIGDNDILPNIIYSTPEEEVARVWLRGVLYHYLNGKPKKNEIPKILYWLSVVDRAVGYNYYFSLSDYYLKECIQTYPNHPYAWHCYAEYENYMNGIHLDSETEFLPIDVHRELQQLKALLKKR